MGIQSKINVFNGEERMFNKVYVHLTDNIFDRVQRRFPRTKKKRIVKKWKSKTFNYGYVPSKSLRIIALIGPGEVRALGHINMKSHLEYLNSIALQSEGPRFIFVNERMEPI